MATSHSQALDSYFTESTSYSEKQLHAVLDSGSKWRFADVLIEGGTAIFPHAYLSKCGEQVAAVVTSALDTGADQFLLLGVLHRLTKEIRNAALRELKGEDTTHEKCRGIFGPGLEGDYWKQEYSLLNFMLLWDAEVKRRGIKPPKVIMRYPNLVHAAPSSVPGIKELETLAKDSVIIATGDLCHHGAAFGSDPQLPIGEEAFSYAKQSILDGYSLLESGDYKTYLDHSIKTASDFYNTGPILRHLIGPKKGSLLDLKLVNVDSFYPQLPSPNWVAASLSIFE